MDLKNTVFKIFCVFLFFCVFLQCLYPFVLTFLLYVCFISPIFALVTLGQPFLLYSNVHFSYFFFFSCHNFMCISIFCNCQHYVVGMWFHHIQVHMVEWNPYLLLTCSLIDRFIVRGMFLGTVSLQEKDKWERLDNLYCC